MRKKNLNSVSDDIKKHIANANELLATAASAAGDEAAELREQAQEILTSIAEQIDNTKERAMEVGQEAVEAGRHTLQHHPWQVLAACAGAGLLVGTLLARNDKG